MSDRVLEVRMLGRFAVLRGGEEIPAAAFGGRLARRLLRVLVSRRGGFVPKEMLADALWPDGPPADPAGNLEVLVSRIRKALGEPALVETGPGGYAFTSDGAVRVDTEDVLEAAAAVGRHLAEDDPQAALEACLHVLDRWVGEPFPEDAYEDWAAEPRLVLSRALLDSLEGGASAALTLGDATSAVSFAERAVAREPLREASVSLLVRGLAAAGDRAAALAAFDAFRERYADELGLDPSPEAEELQRRVLRGETPSLSRRRSGGSTDRVHVQDPVAFAFVGRESEVGRALDTGGVVLVRGPSGAGKTRLLDEISARASVPVLRTRAFLAERSEPWSLARSILREALGRDPLAVRTLPATAAVALLDLLPEMAELRPVATIRLDPPSRRGLAFEGARRILENVAAAPTLLLVDDLQWADSTSLQLLSILAARVEPLRLVLAYRADDAWAVGAFLEELERGRRATTIGLGPLDAEAIGALMGSPALASVMVEETDALPLTVTETLRALETAGLAAPESNGRWRPIDDLGFDPIRAAAGIGQRRAIEARVGRLPPTSRRILTFLSILRRETSERTLAAAAQLPRRDTLDRLDALATDGLVRAGERGWTTAHDTIAETVVLGLSPADSARVHALLATALALEGAESSEIARHLEAAGDTSSAAPRYAEAAELALRRFANKEAEAFADAGLAIAADEAIAGSLRASRAEARTRSGDLPGARDDLRAALATSAEALVRSELLSRMAMLEGGSDDYERAADLVELALGEAGADPRSRAGALAVGAIVDLNLGRLDRSRERADAALAAFGSIGDARGAAGILDGRAMATFIGGGITEAVGLFDRVAKLFLDSGELLRVGTPRSTRGHGLVFMARPDEGLNDIDEALELERTLGHAEGEAYALWHRAEALAALERPDDAIESASDALAIAERIGHREWTVASLRGLGLAYRAAGDVGAATEAFARSAELGGAIPQFSGWALAQQAMCLIAAGRLGEAAPLVARALSGGTPLSDYEARLADVELRAACDDPTAAAAAVAAAAAAELGGHLASLPRLRAIAAQARA